MSFNNIIIYFQKKSSLLAFWGVSGLLFDDI